VTRTASFAVALVGLGISAYLTVVHYAGAEPVCAISHGCATVQQSDYAQLAGIPVAVLGLLGYLTLLGALWVDSDPARLLAAFVAFVGLGFSLWLTYVEVFKIDAICIWCVGSAICMAVLAALTASRLPAGQPASA
jgi:uncharacterized membrane protein